MEEAKFLKSVEYSKKYCELAYELKDKQLQCMENIVKGKDTIGLLPTGYGKSLIYTLLPSILDHYHNKAEGHHIVVLISPLQALMEEQIAKITSQGISAVYLGSTKLTDGK